MSALSPWQSRVYTQAAAALLAGKLGHAQLFCGPARLGKRAVAERLAQRLVCDAAVGIEPCDACRSCRQYVQRFQRETTETRPDGALAHPDGHPGHPDVSFVGFALNEKSNPKKMRTEIVIDQVRELGQKLLVSPQYGRARVVLIEPAEAVNAAGANALLKTLEEPIDGRFIFLVSAHPARLSATIRSRCQRIEFRVPPADESVAWLVSRGHAAADVEEALRSSRGHPGLADDWLRNGGLDVRRQVGADLQKIARGDATPQEVAQQWAAGDITELRLRHAADLVVERAANLTDPRLTRSLAAWFDRANRSRDLLRTTVRADLVLMELLTAWRAAARTGQEYHDR